MKIDTPLHADHQLDQLAGQFEHWRQTRAHPRERIPEPLWEQAVALAGVYPAPGWRNTCAWGERPQKTDGHARRAPRRLPPAL